MKKSIIIVIIIGVVILGLFVWLGQSKPLDNTLNNLQTEKNAAQEKMTDAVLNGATLNIALAVEDYYQKNNTGVFENDATTKNKIDADLAKIKSERGVYVEYTIHSTDSNYVIKTKTQGSDNFYCLDTTSESVKPIIVNSNADFNTATDCKGMSLK